MSRWIVLLFAGGLACTSLWAQSPAAQPSAAQKAARPAANLPALAAIPDGKTTVLGGEIRGVDPVRDQLTLVPYGGKRIKILYDERTGYFVNGVKKSLRGLTPAKNASVQTVLDGTSIFAVSIHVLTQAPGGETEGRVGSWNPATGLLTVRGSLAREPIAMRVPSGTPIVRTGQAARQGATASPSDLTPGTLVSVEFTPGSKGQGIAHKVSILASPGEIFTFGGTLTYLDLHARALAVADTASGETYRIRFYPEIFADAHRLKVGQAVTVDARYNGTGYDAIKISRK